MKRKYYLSVTWCVCLLLVAGVNAFAKATYHLMVAPATTTAHSVVLLWDKQYAKDSLVYDVWVNGKLSTSTSHTNVDVTGLTPSTKYTFSITAHAYNSNVKLSSSEQLICTTSAESTLFNILNFGALSDSSALNTKAIQAAIDACSPNGTVYIPKGYYVSGALFLKSNMTLYIEKGAVLKGSSEPEDYLPMVFNRFEGWEMNTYASLINAGKLDRNNITASNIRICGEGAIIGGGTALGRAMVSAAGDRSRGRLICLMSCSNVCMSGLTLKDPPAWNLHYIYSNSITCCDLLIDNDVRNGDGIDPDSSTDSYIFNCTFKTGDDCIAVTSGKNPEGYYVGKPTVNVRITNCNFIKGHGISIGSEMSGGISNVLVQDCRAGNLLNGFQIKGTKDRGGYVKNVTVADCELQKITVYSALNYNNDGEPAPQVPVFENFIFRNIDLSTAKDSAVIIMHGFKDVKGHFSNVQLSDVRMPANAQVIVSDADNVKFTNVVSAAGAKPAYKVTNSEQVIY